MLDRKFLRDNPEEAKNALALRGEDFPPMVDRFIQIDEERRSQQVKLDELKAQRNNASKEIGALMKQGDKDLAEEKKSYVRDVNDEITRIEESHSSLEDEERMLLLSMPNMPGSGIPVGGENKAELVKEHGEPKKFNFEPKDHVELCDSLQLVNFEAGTRIAGSGFPAMHGAGAILQRALINMMLDLHIYKHGYTEVRPPFIVHPRAAEGTGQLPKFSEDMYHINIEGQPPPDGTEGPHYFLIPTAEVPVVNYYREQILEAPALPVKLAAYSPCWRVEGGSYGKEARGLTRVHQFEKVELIRFADPETSYSELEDLTAEAEAVLEMLGLPYRRIVLPTGDMAFGSAKTYDLEVWCAADSVWREVSSASNTTDYQARRANIRIRREKGAKPEFPHILNASGLALPRLVIALLEYYQTESGTVELPEALHKYMPDMTTLTAPDGGVPFV